MSDMTGKTLGKYRLTGRLGRGGMAEVYRAYQPALERDVAIKVMHSYMAEDEEFVGRFRREAKAVAALRHPHIVQVYDFDIHDDVYYMVMEHIRGETLKARLQGLNVEGVSMPLEEMVRIFRALCDALDYAHEQGRIHRDLKPANIMFDGDRLVLTDFGIASIVGGTRYTASGAMVGTPAYMSPEQGAGQPGDVQSDVYSLGIILYEIATGRLPYDADTPLAILLKHINEPLPLPSQASANVPPAMEKVILKALAKSPKDRYQRAGELADALEAATKGAETMVKATRPVQKRPAAPAQTRLSGRLLGIGALVVLAVLVVIWLTWPRSENNSELLGLPTELAALSDPDPGAVDHYEAGLAAFEQEGDYEGAIKELTRAIEADASFAEAYYWRGVVYYEDGEGEAAEADLSEAIALRPDMVEAYYQRGSLYLYYLDRPEEALAALDRAIELDSSLAEAYIRRSQYHLWYSENIERAIADLDRALELAPNSAEVWGLHGEVYFWEDEYELALPKLARAIELDPEDSWLWEMLGFSYYALGEYEESVVRYDKAIELDPTELSLYYGRAFAYLEMGDSDAAMEDLDRVLLLESDNSVARYGRGRIEMEAGEYEEAIADLTEVIKDEDEEYSWVYFEEDSPYIDRALAYQALGRTEEALDDLNTVIAEEEDWYLPHYYRGLIYKDLGQTEAAIADFRMAWENAPDEEWRQRAENELAALQEE